MSGDTQSGHDAQAAFGAPSEQRQASKLGYLFAGLLAVAAIAGAIAWAVLGFTGLDDNIDDLQRVPVPGAQVVTLEAGDNAIYYESSDGSDAAVPALNVQLSPVGGGPSVAIGPHGGDVSYSVGGHAGRSILGFDLERAGRYAMTVELVGEPLHADAVLAVGKGVGGQIVSAIVGGLVIFFGGLLLAGVAIIVTARRRRSA